MKRLKVGLGAAALSAALTMLPSGALSQQEYFSIGTGGVTGVYYPTGGAICRLVNLGRLDHGLRCFVEPTEGSIDNINAVRKGDFEFGVAQSDWQFHAYNGTSRFEQAGAFTDLRSVFSVHQEPFTLVVRSDSDIASFADLTGQRVNIGNPGSGMRSTMEVLMSLADLNSNDFGAALELPAAEQPQALCNGDIDAMIYTVGHPSAAVIEATTTCDARLVSVTGPAVDQLISDNNDYRAATIAGGMYNGTDGDIETFGVIATVVTSASVPEEIVYTAVKSVFDNFSSFTNLHPAFNTLTEQAMISDGLTAPFHPGAERYYRERGWIQ